MNHLDNWLVARRTIGTFKRTSTRWILGDGAQRRGALVIVLMIGIVATPRAATGRDAARSVHHSPHLEHTTFISGVGAALYTAWNPGRAEDPSQTVTAPGVRGFVELSLIEDVAELEVSAAGFWEGADSRFVVADLLLKKSFEFGRFNPYVGVGPSLSIDLVNGESETSVGASLAIGCYHWITDHFGLDLDVTYGLISRGGGTGQELTVSLGPVVRF